MRRNLIPLLAEVFGRIATAAVSDPYNGLQHQWLCEDRDTTLPQKIRDSIGGLDLTPVNVTFRVPGRYKRGCELSGTSANGNATLTGNGALGGSTFTIAGWVKTAGSGADETVSLFSIDGTQSFRINWDSITAGSETKLSVDIPGQVQAAAITIATDADWHFFACRVNGTDVTLWLDKTTQTATASQEVTAGTTVTFSNPSLTDLVTQLDSLRYWDRALTSNEVDDVCNGDLEGTPMDMAGVTVNGPGSISSPMPAVAMVSVGNASLSNSLAGTSTVTIAGSSTLADSPLDTATITISGGGLSNSLPSGVITIAGASALPSPVAAPSTLTMAGGAGLSSPISSTPAVTIAGASTVHSPVATPATLTINGDAAGLSNPISSTATITIGGATLPSPLAAAAALTISGEAAGLTSAPLPVATITIAGAITFSEPLPAASVTITGGASISSPFMSTPAVTISGASLSSPLSSSTTVTIGGSSITSPLSGSSIATMGGGSSLRSSPLTTATVTLNTGVIASDAPLAGAGTVTIAGGSGISSPLMATATVSIGTGARLSVGRLVSHNRIYVRALRAVRKNFSTVALADLSASSATVADWKKD